LLLEMKRVLKIHGHVSGSVPEHSKMTFYQLKQILLLRLRFAYAVHQSLLAGEHKWQYSVAGLSLLLKRLGFSNIDVYVVRKFPFLDGEIHFKAENTTLYTP